MTTEESKDTPPEKPRCFLRSTKVKLLDGVEYTFRALPFTDSTISVINALIRHESASAAAVEDFEVVSKIMEAIRKSLSYDYEPAVVESLLDNGVIPFPPSNDRQERIFNRIMTAMMASMPGAKKDGS